MELALYFSVSVRSVALDWTLDCSLLHYCDFDFSISQFELDNFYFNEKKLKYIKLTNAIGLYCTASHIGLYMDLSMSNLYTLWVMIDIIEYR